MRHLPAAAAAAAPLCPQVIRRLHVDQYLERKQGCATGPRGVVSVLGTEDGLANYLAQGPGSDSLPEGLNAKEAEARLRLLFSRGVVQAAMDMNSVLVSSGLDIGPVRLAGKANRERNHRVPLLGVVSRGAVTWPGDDRPAGKQPRRKLQARPRPAPQSRARDQEFVTPLTHASESLQEDHTHFVMLDTDDITASAAYRFKLTNALLICAFAPLLLRSRLTPCLLANVEHGRPLWRCRRLWRGPGRGEDHEGHAAYRRFRCERRQRYHARGSGGACSRVLWPRRTCCPTCSSVLREQLRRRPCPQCVRRGWPIIAVAGSGGCANMICAKRPPLASDPPI